MKRIKPTDKYNDYQQQIHALEALVSAMLNDTLVTLEPVTQIDPLSNGDNVVITQSVIMADWAEEVRVYCTFKREARHASDKIGVTCCGNLAYAIADLMKNLPYCQPMMKLAYQARIDQLIAISQQFDESGRRAA